MALTDEERRRLSLFRDWIRAVQVETGLVPSTIAERAGMSHTTITRPLARDDSRAPKWGTIVRIAEAVGVEPPVSLAPPAPLTQSYPATVDDDEPVRHHDGKEGSGEGGGMRSTDIEILSQLVEDYGPAEVVRQVRQLPETGSRQKRGVSS